MLSQHTITLLPLHLHVEWSASTRPVIHNITEASAWYFGTKVSPPRRSLTAETNDIMGRRRPAHHQPSKVFHPMIRAREVASCQEISYCLQKSIVSDHEGDADPIARPYAQDAGFCSSFPQSTYSNNWLAELLPKKRVEDPIRHCEAAEKQGAVGARLRGSGVHCSILSSRC